MKCIINLKAPAGVWLGYDVVLQNGSRWERYQSSSAADLYTESIVPVLIFYCFVGLCFT